LVHRALPLLPPLLLPPLLPTLLPLPLLLLLLSLAAIPLSCTFQYFCPDAAL
jgi:hypothetical protein